MNPTINNVVFDLLEAVVTLYPANPDGSPQLGSPLWTGAPAENLRCAGTWLKQATTPGGAKHPRNHPLIAQYQVKIGRVWILDTVLSSTGFAPDWTRYVLDVCWTDESTQQWHRKTFYGVTIESQEWNAADIQSGLLEDQVFSAEYFVPSSGLNIPPAISASLPYFVNYSDVNGTVQLYTYDPVAQTFTATSDTTNRAVIAPNVGLATPFAVTFAGAGSPVVAATGTSMPYDSDAVFDNDNSYQQLMLTVNGGLFTTPPPGAQPGLGNGTTPRLDFYYGTTRVFTVTPAGLFGNDFDEGTPATGTGIFALQSSGAVVATIGTVEAVATQFEVTG